MAFKMNRPIIKGTKKHSALLAKMDQTLIEAANLYGKSQIAQDIDFRLKFDAPEVEEIDRRKKKKKKIEIDDPVEEKKVVAKVDEEKAIDELKDKITEREGIYSGTTTGTEVTAFGKDIKSLEGVSAENLIKLKSVSPEDIELGRVQDVRIDGESAWVERPWYTKQRIKAKKQSTKTLMAEYGTTDPVKIEKIYQANQKALRTKIREEFEAKYDTKNKKVKKIVEKKIEEEVKKQEENLKVEKETGVTSGTVKEKPIKPIKPIKPRKRRNVAKEREYKMSSSYIQAQMRRRDPNYPWPEINK